jgi:hypothetical protein
MDIETKKKAKEKGKAKRERQGWRKKIWLAFEWHKEGEKER